MVGKFFLTFVLTVCLSGCGVGYMMSSSWYQMKLLLSRVDLDEARGSGRLSAEQLETLVGGEQVGAFAMAGQNGKRALGQVGFRQHFPDDDGADVTYTASNLVNGHIEVIGSAQSTFTQADINAENVVFIHDDSQTTSASFGISLADGGENGSTPATGTFNIIITPVNSKTFGLFQKFNVYFKSAF